MKNDQEISILKISPYVRYVNDIYFPEGSTIPKRMIYDHEWVFGLDGEAMFGYDGKSYVVKASDLLYIKPNRINTMYVEKGKFFHAHCVHFDWKSDEQSDFSAERYYLNQKLTREELACLERLKRRISYEIPEQYCPPFTQGLDSNILQPMFQELYNAFCLPALSAKLRLQSIFINIVSELLASQLERPQHNGLCHKKTIDNAISYLGSHYHMPLTVPQLAREFGMSPKYFGVQFKSSTGLSVMEYLQGIRLQAAKKLLLSSGLPLESIAEQVGIRDVAYFIKIFKKSERITPGKYRKMLSALEK